MTIENSLKAGVDLRNLATQWGVGYPIVAECFNRRGYSCVVTSGNDSVHMVGSLHPSGYALDFRTRHVAMIDKASLAATIRTCLGDQFDVVLEHVGMDGEHLHVEFQPKVPEPVEV